MKQVLFLFFLLSTFLVHAQVKSPEEIQKELDQAQRDFEIAQKMFIPWYTGPLITGSANNVPKGKKNAQGYIFVIADYGEFTSNRKSINVPTTYTLEPLGLFQAGVTSWLDMTLTMNGNFKWQREIYAQSFGDTVFTLGVPLLIETPYKPAIRFTVGESFPTGKYKRLNPTKGGLDAGGSGAYETQFGLNISKIFWWYPLHPIRIRFASLYSFADHRVRVRGFNSYGGGFQTAGKVSVGSSLSLDAAFEVALTQRWVFAMDLAYSLIDSSSFSGNPGITAGGTPASVGAPSSDQLSLAPEIEYNVSDRGGLIAGVWFPLTGRNSSDFIALIVSYTYLF